LSIIFYQKINQHLLGVHDHDHGPVSFQEEIDSNSEVLEPVLEEDDDIGVH
jgi:hypothetical protein